MPYCLSEGISLQVSKSAFQRGGSPRSGDSKPCLHERTQTHRNRRTCTQMNELGEKAPRFGCKQCPMLLCRFLICIFINNIHFSLSKGVTQCLAHAGYSNPRLKHTGHKTRVEHVRSLTQVPFCLVAIYGFVCVPDLSQPNDGAYNVHLTDKETEAQSYGRIPL